MRSQWLRDFRKATTGINSIIVCSSITDGLVPYLLFAICPAGSIYNSKTLAFYLYIVIKSKITPVLAIIIWLLLSWIIYMTFQKYYFFSYTMRFVLLVRATMHNLSFSQLHCHTYRKINQVCFPLANQLSSWNGSFMSHQNQSNCHKPSMKKTYRLKQSLSSFLLQSICLSSILHYAVHVQSSLRLIYVRLPANE